MTLAAMKIAAALLALALVAGLLVPFPAPAQPRRMDEYTVLTGDFHVHMFPLDAATLSPWDVVVEARRRGLHVIALTGHNQTWTAAIGRWFADRTGGPLVLIGEEVITPAFDMIAVGLRETVDFRGSALDVARRIHAQGAVAIAAHPFRGYWAGLEPAIDEMDGAEVAHPDRFQGAEQAAELDEFFARRPFTAIGSSDFHATGFPGFSRTYVFVREFSEAAILEALRNQQTVVVDRDGTYIGDTELIAVAKANGGLDRGGHLPDPGAWGLISRYAALAAMVLACVFGFLKGK
jgi:predicted metal-dependent phosphoesterase TrpH